MPRTFRFYKKSKAESAQIPRLNEARVFGTVIANYPDGSGAERLKDTLVREILGNEKTIYSN